MSNVPWRDQIKQALEAKGMTRVDLADQLGVSVSTLNDFLIPSARRGLTFHRARLLSLALGMNGLQLILDYTEQEYRRAYPR